MKDSTEPLDTAARDTRRPDPYGEHGGQRLESEFATTRWSLVQAAGRGSGRSSADALAQLCARYWLPVFAYVRRRCRSADDAADLVQAFFCWVLEKQALAAADPSRGRFRAFLLTSLKHFLANECERQAALKRGGGRAPLSLDVEQGEARYQLHPIDQLTPEILFERQWILSLLDDVLSQLQAEYVAAGKADEFHLLKSHLTGGHSAQPYAAVATQLGVNSTAARVAAHRLRQRYRSLLRAAVADTLADPSEVDDEIRRMFVNLGVDRPAGGKM